jgi:hypothetical protein
VTVDELGRAYVTKAIDFQKFNFQPVGLKKFPQGVKFICPIKLRALRNELGGKVW